MPWFTLLALIIIGGLAAACTGEVGHGMTGVAGDDGAAGSPGAAGTTGAAGTAGPAGAAGSGGQPGAAGASSPSGIAGTGGAPSGAAGSGKGGATASGKGGAAGAATGGRGGASAAKGGSTGSAGAPAVGGAPGGGSGGAPAAGGAPGGGDPAGYVPALIGVGYGGIRIVSRDGGKTWGDRTYDNPNGDDDGDLLRAVVYGNGLWLATGWKMVTSTDGVTWTDRGQLGQAVKIGNCNIVEGLAFNAGYFFAACAPSNIYRSTDGLTWTKYSSVGGDVGGHMTLTYRAGKFVSYGDSGTSYESPDGLTWTVMPGLTQATFCQDTFKNRSDCPGLSWFEGAFLRAQWGGVLQRSTDGKSFTKVYTDDQKNTLYDDGRPIAAGFVAPK